MLYKIFIESSIKSQKKRLKQNFTTDGALPKRIYEKFSFMHVSKNMLSSATSGENLFKSVFADFYTTL